MSDRRRFPARLATVVLAVTMLAFSSPATAKDHAVSLRLKAKYDGSRILFRWAPSDMNTHYTYTLFALADGKETPVGTYGKVALEQIAGDYPKETATLITALLYPQSLYKTDTEKLEALSQKDNQKGMAFYLAELKPDVARVLGLWAEDTSVQAGKTYGYVLRAYENGKEKASQTVSVSTMKPAEIHPPTVTARRYDWGCALRWTRYDAFTAFHVYRGTAEHQDFVKITPSPVSVNAIRKDSGLVETPPFFYSDTTTEKSKTAYYYKVTGIDSFGDESPLSAAAFAIRDASLRPAPQMPVGLDIIEPFIRVSFSIDSASGITGVNVYRSSLYNGRYEKLNQAPITSPSYMDQTASYDVNYFYCHTAVDANGMESVMSLPQLAVLRDRTPPSVPRSLNAVAEKGAVHLSWLPVTDSDFSAYEVYRASSPDAPDWAMLTKDGQTEPRFTDTMSALLDKTPFYYKVLAKDNLANRSAFSDIIEITLPDVTPPVPPAWIGGSSGKNAVILTWQASPTRDIKGYRLYRGRGNTRVKVADLPKEGLTYTDQVSAGETAWYFLSAVDTGGNESELSSGLEVKHADRVPVSLKGLTVTATEEGIRIALNPAAPDFSAMTIRRRRPDQGTFRTIASNHKMPEYLDKYVNPRTAYVYRITAYDRSGNVTTGPDVAVTSK